MIGVYAMLFITICDDSLIEIDQILLLLEDFSYKKTKLSIQTFNSSMSLVKSIEAGNMSDIFLLDIVMPGLSGIDIGSLIRQKNKDACIIFITNSTEFALNAFEIYALQYLLKPVKKSALYDALNKAIQVLEKKDKFFIVDTSDGKVSIKHKDIIFIEYLNHVMNFHTINKVISSKHIRVSFSTALEEILKNPSFIQPHRAYVINMHHIKKLKKRVFLMTRSYEIPISKNHQENSIKLYMQYVFGEDFTNA
jgi:DNA-binding LytR/AlgR family response regulator